jgi:hypothetical protein
MTSPEKLPDPHPEQMTADDLQTRLINAGIDIAMWGSGGAKTVSHLLAEIIEGESEVSFDAQGRVERSVRVAWVDVLFFDNQGNALQLVEDRQEYHDGRVRKRQLESSLGEKFKPSETPEEAAMRALSEELGVDSFKSLNAIGHEQTTHTPDSYPGLKSSYDTYSFVAVLDESSYHPEGYIEHQADKTNYYTWAMIRPAGA